MSAVARCFLPLFLVLATRAAVTLSITNPSPLPNGTVGSAYSQTFAVAGGVAPYHWAGAGSLPAGLTFDGSSGVLSGTPSAKGTFSFTIQVSDSVGNMGSKNFSLTIDALPLAITTDTLFSATVGLPYSQTLLANGGTPPYKWSTNSDQLPSGITLDANTGTLSGTPQAAGTFTFTVQVADSAGGTVSRSLTLVVNVPRLTIVTGSPLPAGTVGVAYAQTLAAIGGTAPYTWSVTAGALPGLTLDPSGSLSGTPTDPGTFNFTVQAKDSAGQTGTKSFNLTINPGPLTITTSVQLPDGVLGQPISQTITAAGGAPPYTWSANGLPDGLSIDSASGIISGSASAGGSFSFTVTVTDNLRATATARLQLRISMPALPAVAITGLPDVSNPADQLKIQVTLSSPYPGSVSGQLSLSFTPDAGSGDGTIQFSTGSRTAAFTIPAGSTTTAVPLAIQTGTVAGTIKLTAQFQSSNIDVTPTPAPSQTTRIKASAPVIVGASLVRSANGFSVQITGYSTAREVTQAVFHFTAASGSTLQSADLTVPVQSVFAKWFQDSASTPFGSEFSFTQPFTVQGDPTAVSLGSVTLSNSFGNSTAIPTN